MCVQGWAPCMCDINKFRLWFRPLSRAYSCWTTQASWWESPALSGCALWPTFRWHPQFHSLDWVFISVLWNSLYIPPENRYDIHPPPRNRPDLWSWDAVYPGPDWHVVPHAAAFPRQGYSVGAYGCGNVVAHKHYYTYPFSQYMHNYLSV